MLHLAATSFNVEIMLVQKRDEQIMFIIILQILNEFYVPEIGKKIYCRHFKVIVYPDLFVV